MVLDLEVEVLRVLGDALAQTILPFYRSILLFFFFLLIPQMNPFFCAQLDFARNGELFRGFLYHIGAFVHEGLSLVRNGPLI